MVTILVINSVCHKTQQDKRHEGGRVVCWEDERAGWSSSLSLSAAWGSAYTKRLRNDEANKTVTGDLRTVDSTP